MAEIPPDPQSGAPSGYSNYPRYGYGPSGGDPYRRPPGVYFDTIGQAWRLFQNNMGTWVGAIVLLWLIEIAIAIPYNIGSNYVLHGSPMGGGDLTALGIIRASVIGLVPGCIFSVFHAGLLNMALKEGRCEPTSIGDVFSGIRRFGSLAIAGLLTTLLIYLGIVLLIVPGLFAIGILSFVPLLILDRNMSPIAAIAEVWTTLRQHGFALFALIFLAGLLMCLGFCACCVGVLFTQPIYVLTIGLAYNNFYPRMGVQPSGYQIGAEPPR